MKNADMPAMPIIDDEQSFPIDGEKYGKSLSSGRFAVGMTKREMMAMNIACAMISASIGKFNHESVGEIFDSAIKDADLFFEKLERTCQKS